MKKQFIFFLSAIAVFLVNVPLFFEAEALGESSKDISVVQNEMPLDDTEPIMLTNTDELDIEGSIDAPWFKKMYNEGRIVFEEVEKMSQNITALNTASKYLSEDILTHIYYSAWEIHFVKEIPGDKYFVGNFGPYSQIIQIENTETSQMTKTIVHEFGHYVDRYGFYYGSIDYTTTSDEFLQLYEKYVDIYPCRDYAKIKPIEFFAQLFTDYFFDEEKLEDYPELEEQVVNALRKFQRRK